MIRIAHADDAAILAAIYQPYVERTWISFEETAPSASDMLAKYLTGREHYPWLIAEHDGEVAGYAYGSVHRGRPAYRWSVETTIYLREDAHGLGLGKRLYGALIETLRKQGFRSAFAGIALPNPASVALHASLGFEPIGIFPAVGFKLGAWRDVAWSRLNLTNEGDAPLPEPLKVSEVLSS